MILVPFTYSGDTLTIFVSGVPKTIDSTHPHFEEAFEIVKTVIRDQETFDHLVGLLDYKAAIEKAVAGQTFGSVTVGQDAVLFNGQVVNSYLTTTMLTLISKGVDITPWAMFMDKLYQNPSKTAVDELFLWLDKAGMPITDKGNFLAYKKVQDDYSSYHTGRSGKVYNHLGTTVEMPRNEVDDDRNRTCSAGLHFCSWHYLPSYYGGKGKVILVEINPADVVSIPSDYDNSKGRAWRYDVVGEIDESQVQFAFSDTTVWSAE